MINDATTTRAIEGLLDLAIAVRDLGPDDVRAAADKVLAEVYGDPHAALTIAAALIRVDQPVDTWWQVRLEGARQARDALRLRYQVSTDVDCEQPGHRTLSAHEAAEQKAYRACLRWQADYRADLRARRKAAA